MARKETVTDFGSHHAWIEMQSNGSLKAFHCVFRVKAANASDCHGYKHRKGQGLTSWPGAAMVCYVSPGLLELESFSHLLGDFRS